MLVSEDGVVKRLFGAIWILVCCGCLLGSASRAAVPMQEPSTEQQEGGDVSTPTPDVTDQVVEVEETVRDSAIEERLTKILEATQRFEQPRVRVDDGVVFLSGVAASTEDAAWARAVALRTEAVVAVVNNITIRPEFGPFWDFSPALATIESMMRSVVRSLPLVIVGLVLLLLTLVAAKLTGRIARSLLASRIENAMIRAVIQKLIVLSVVLVGAYIFLQVSGLTRLAVTVLGGTGVLGLVLGFAFRDIAENFLASLLISVQRPFRIGDTIEVDGLLGVVRRVTTRGTLLIDFDGNHILVTNSKIFKSTITNYTTNPNMRIQFTVGIGYDASITKAQSVALEVMQGHAAVLDQPEPSVLIDALGGASINMQLTFWIDGHEHSKVKVRSSVMRQVVRALIRAGVSLPDEDREVLFGNPIQVRMIDADGATDGAAEHTTGADGAVGTTHAIPVHDEDDELMEDLSSEVDDLESQAETSRESDSGEDLLPPEEKNERSGESRPDEVGAAGPA